MGTANSAANEDAPAGASIGAALVRITDVGGEEVDVGPGRLVAGGGDQRRDQPTPDSETTVTTPGRSMVARSWLSGQFIGSDHTTHITHDN